MCGYIHNFFFRDRALARFSLSRIKEFCYRQCQVTVIQKLPKPTPLTHTTVTRGCNYMKKKTTKPCYIHNSYSVSDHNTYTTILMPWSAYETVHWERLFIHWSKPLKLIWHSWKQHNETQTQQVNLYLSQEICLAHLAHEAPNCKCSQGHSTNQQAFQLQCYIFTKYPKGQCYIFYI
jgi:hypothetical protein